MRHHAGLLPATRYRKLIHFALCAVLGWWSAGIPAGFVPAPTETVQEPKIISAVVRSADGSLLWATAEAVAAKPRLLPAQFEDDAPLEFRAESGDAGCNQYTSVVDQWPPTLAELTHAATDVFTARVQDAVPGFSSYGAGTMLRLRVDGSNETVYLFTSHAHFRVGDTKFCSGVSPVPVSRGNRILVLQTGRSEITPRVLFDAQSPFVVFDTAGVITFASKSHLRDELRLRKIGTENALRTVLAR